MSHNFKPGDPALTLVNDRDLPAMSEVVLLSRFEKGEYIGFAFHAPTAGWFVRHAAAIDPLPFGEAELMPLRGDFAPERQKSREVIA